jgi:hypothetical protein
MREDSLILHPAVTYRASDHAVIYDNVKVRLKGPRVMMNMLPTWNKVLILTVFDLIL